MNLSLPLGHPDVETVNQPKLRRSLVLEITKEMEIWTMDWGVGGRGVWISVAIPYLFSIGVVYQVWGRVHKVNCSRRNIRC